MPEARRPDETGIWLPRRNGACPESDRCLAHIFAEQAVRVPATRRLDGRDRGDDAEAESYQTDTDRSPHDLIVARGA